MKIFVFDVETTGLMSDKNASITDTTKWPYIVQLSYLIYDTVFNKITLINDDIIRLPKSIIISDICSGIHGITNEKSQALGVDIKYALIKFNEYIKKADIIVGHNISFDKRLIMVECIRNSIRQNFTVNGIRKNEYCTMKNGINICKIQAETYTGRKYFKYPKLSELYYHYFKKIPDGLHNSKIDILVTLRCYCMMIHNYDICNYVNFESFYNNKNQENDDIITNINIGSLTNDIIISDNYLQNTILHEYESSPKRQRHF
jgi:DNA polymerase III epsilon subunit-like protein